MKIQIKIPAKNKSEVLAAFAFESAKPQAMTEEAFMLREIQDFVKAKLRHYKKAQAEVPQVDVSDVAEASTTEA